MVPTDVFKRVAGFAAVIALVTLVGGSPARSGARGGAAPASALDHADLAYVDAHNHLPLTPGLPGCELAAGAQTALTIMDRFGVAKTLILPAPHSDEGSCEPGHLAAVVADHPDRFGFLAGGESLNPMIQALAPEVVGPADLEAFEAKALEILRLGTVGFGEMAAEHFSFHAGHPYETALPDHPLFLRLTDIAARYDVPIDLHMEAIAFAMPFADIAPCSGALRSAANPATLSENISGLERLLAHNRRARMVWVHAGWDNTGHRTVALTRRLIEDHSNLHVQIRPNGLGNQCDPEPLPNSVLDADGTLDPDWLDLIRAFPERFTIGLDSFYPPDIRPAQVMAFFGSARRFLDQLPPGLARLVGAENAVRLYNLDRSLVCHRPGTPAARSMWVSATALGAHLRHGDRLGVCEP